ncbi:MAG: DUF2381 family protein [Archangium sp.]
MSGRWTTSRSRAAGLHQQQALGGRLPVFLISSAVLMSLVLLASPPEAAGLPLPDECEPASSLFELPAEPGGRVPGVCIGSGVSTTFRFDSPLVPSSMEIQERERFADVAVGKTSLTVVPPEDLVPGERFKVVVCFADGVAPACAAFSLVAHPGLAMQQVNVFRQPHPVAYYQQEARAARAEAERYRAEVQRLRAERGTPGWLTALLAAGLIDDEHGVVVHDLSERLPRHKRDAFRWKRVYSYRSKGRVAVEVQLDTPDAMAWKTEGAALRGPQGKLLQGLTLWQLEPLAGTTWVRVVVEQPVTEEEARGTYTLTLWDASRSRTITLANVVFP